MGKALGEINLDCLRYKAQINSKIAKPSLFLKFCSVPEPVIGKSVINDTLYSFLNERIIRVLIEILDNIIFDPKTTSSHRSIDEGQYHELKVFPSAISYAEHV